MPQWSASTQAALSSGDNLQCLGATETSPNNGALKGFALTPAQVPVQLAIFNGSGQTLTLQASLDNVTWLPVNANGNQTVPTGSCAMFAVGGGMNYRLANAVAIVAGGTVWVAR